MVDEGRLNGSSRLVEIVFENLKEQFGGDLDTMRKCYNIVKESNAVSEEVKQRVNGVYKQLKQSS